MYSNVGFHHANQRHRFKRAIMSFVGEGGDEKGKGERGKRRVGEKCGVWGRERADAPVMRTGRRVPRGPPPAHTHAHTHTHTHILLSFERAVSKMKERRQK